MDVKLDSACSSAYIYIYIIRSGECRVPSKELKGHIPWVCVNYVNIKYEAKSWVSCKANKLHGALNTTPRALKQMDRWSADKKWRSSLGSASFHARNDFLFFAFLIRQKYIRGYTVGVASCYVRVTLQFWKRQWYSYNIKKRKEKKRKWQSAASWI